MFKDVFVLKKSSWHAKLMKWIWDLKTSDFTHMCPYFWLSVFNVVVFPLFFLIRYTLMAAVYFVKDQIAKFDDYTDRKAQEWYAREKAKITNNEAYLKTIDWSGIDRPCNKRWKRLIIDIFHDINYNDQYTPEFRTSFRQWYYSEKDKEFNKTQLKAAEKSFNAGKKKVNKLLKYIKPISQVFLYILAGVSVIAATYGIYRLVIILSNAPHQNWVNFGYGVLLAIAIALVAFIIWLSVRLLTKVTISCKTKKIANKTLKVVFFPIYGIGAFVVFIVQMLSDNCPAINWKD